MWWGKHLSTLALLFLLASITVNAQITITKDVILDPSQSLASFVFNFPYTDTRPVVVESTYIVVGGIKFEVMPTDPTTVLITKWKPDYVNDPDKIPFEFVLFTSGTTRFDLLLDGLTPNTTYAIYKDGKLFKTIKTDGTTLTFNDSITGSSVYAIRVYTAETPTEIPTPQVTPPEEVKPRTEFNLFSLILEVIGGSFGSVLQKMVGIVFGFSLTYEIPTITMSDEVKPIVVGAIILIIALAMYFAERR